MRKCLVAIGGAIAVLALALLASNRVEAGASASAPSKYTNQASSHSYPITEYSSSNRKTVHKHH